MSDTRDLRIALAALQRQKDSKQRELDRIDNAMRVLDDMIAMEGEGAQSDEFRDMSIADAAARVLHEARPVGRTTREIADALLKRGITTSAKNFSMTVYTTLRETGRFERTNGSWFLKDSSSDEARPARGWRG